MSKNPFQPAAKVAKKLKVLLYGASGSGKTRAALTFPRPAVIDTENGTDLYAGRPGVPEFSVLRAKTLSEVEAAVAFIREDNGKTFDTLVIDAITVLYDIQKDAAAKSSKDGEMNPRLWNRVNGRMVALYNSLTNLPCHVVVIARESELYEGEGLNLKRTGVKPDGDKKMTYMFDFVVRMKMDHSGEMIKSRGVNISNAMPEVTWKAFEKAAGMFTDGAQAAVISDEQAVQMDAKAYADDAPVQSQPSGAQNAAKRELAAQTPTQNDTPVLLSSTDEAKWPLFLKWNKDKLGLDERAVMVALSAVVKDGVYKGPRELAMAHVLAASAGYQASEIKSIGAELKLDKDAVIAEALLIAPPVTA